MRLTVVDFLSQLKERDELDSILPDLLVAMGYRIVKSAHRGEVERGIDIAALANVEGEDVLYVFQVKAGDITPTLWHDGPNGVRASLDNIRDATFNDYGEKKIKNARRIVVVAHNGEMRENVRDFWNGYADKYPYPIERWGIGKIADLIVDNLLNEYLLPPRLRRLFSKTLAFVDAPDYSFEHFKELLELFFESKPNKKKNDIFKRLATIRLLLVIVNKFAEEANNIKPSITVTEMALLRAWDWLLKSGSVSDKDISEYLKLFSFWPIYASAFAVKIAPILSVEDGLFFDRKSDTIEYPIRCFDQVELLGLMAILCKCQGLAEQCQAFSGLLAKCIQNNMPGCSRPLLDNHMISIYLGMAGLMAGGQRNVAIEWLSSLFLRITTRHLLKGNLPELYNRMDLVIELEVGGEKTIQYVDSSSTLLYMLFELTIILGAPGLYDNYRDKFEKVNLQVWNPPSDVEESLYLEEVTSGRTEVSIELPDEFSKFVEEANHRHDAFGGKSLTTVDVGLPWLPLLASKHYRTPIIPSIWRTALFGLLAD